MKKSLSIYIFLTILLSLMRSSSAVLSSVNGLYIGTACTIVDGFNMMSVSTPGTQYNGTIPWRATITTIVYKGVAMHTFATPPAKIVSINCGFVSVSTTSG
jgi:hypothetical protein